MSLVGEDSWLKSDKAKKTFSNFLEKLKEDGKQKSASESPAQAKISDQAKLSDQKASPYRLTSAEKQKASEMKSLRAQILSSKDLNSKEVRGQVKQLAELYAHFYDRNAEEAGRDQSVFPFLEETTKLWRQITNTQDAGGSDLEIGFEGELSQAINKRAEGLSTEGVAREALENNEQWAAQNKMGEPRPRIAGSDSIKQSYEFVKLSLEAMGLVAAASALMESGKNLTKEETEKLKKSLEKWSEHDFVKLRANEKNEPALRTLPNQNLKWGKVASLELMNELQKNPSLQKLLPEGVQGEGFKTLFNAMEKSLYENAKMALRGGTEDGVGGSNDHTAMVSSMLTHLSKEHREELIPQYLSLLEKNGAKDGRVQYTPFWQLPVNETPRGSAGRGVGVALAEFQVNPNEEGAKKALAALEQFNLYSGTLRANVNRSGVHALDGVAPYYWAPNLLSAGKLVSGMAEAMSKNPNEFSSETKSRLGAVNNLSHVNKAENFLGNRTPSPVPSPSDEEEIAPQAPAVPESPAIPDSPLLAFSKKVQAGELDPQALADLKKDFEEAVQEAKPKSVGELKKLLTDAGLRVGSPEYQYFLASGLANWNRPLGSSDLSDLLNLKKAETGKADSFIREQASLALKNQKRLPENQLGLNWLGKASPLLLSEEEALQKYAERREAWSSGSLEKQKELAREMAQEMYSVNLGVRKELKEMALKNQEKAKESSLESALGHLYGGASISHSKLASVLDTEKAAAKQRAIDWHKKLEEGNPDWLKNQIKEIGEDKFLKWTAQVGGETGNRVLKKAMSLGELEIQATNKAQGYQPGDRLSIRADSHPAAELNKMLSRKSAEEPSVILSFERVNTGNGRMAYLDQNGELKFEQVPKEEKEDETPPAPVGLDSLKSVLSSPSEDLERFYRQWLTLPEERLQKLLLKSALSPRPKKKMPQTKRPEKIERSLSSVQTP